ncbi:hypothetical protein SNOG_13908 [Parastagonospora nodorum SN15]|uniref:Major facilitator superfamily (MFS) profile domain-containing protein n=1 Tax=Phaeosphaeria nodorum (strain SN15 / ATCC MYA-4574 / FGSC 10173) TaxID=321614 RepID=Q0U2M6_PHANO|nr:hypothetical protein SNOG_13908 [Parastagonospora nodorum SN15]EAT78533.2 hypothetical protein SNOG_13908 [Parastagonospora nodorum SN15]
MALVRKVIPQLDLFGFLLFIPAAVMILLALQFGSGNTFAWDSATIIGLLVGGVVMALIFIAWEWHMGDLAMLPGNLIKQRIVWTSACFAMGNMVCVIVASNFLPTYFQALIDSVTRWGYYLPWAFASAVVMTVGNGLISTFTPTTAVARWIGYQILLGGGRGLGLQTPLIAIQNAVQPSQVPVGMAFLIFLQNLGATVGAVIANTILAQTLTNKIPQYAPSVAPQAALEAGSDPAAIRHLVDGHENELNGVLLAYTEGLRNIFYLLVGMSAISFFMSFGMGWVDVRRKKDVTAQEDGEVHSGKVEVEKNGV